MPLLPPSMLITTKTGKRESHAEVNYSGYVTFSKWSKKADFMDTHDVIYGKTAQEYLGYDTNWLDGISRITRKKRVSSVRPITRTSRCSSTTHSLSGMTF